MIGFVKRTILHTIGIKVVNYVTLTTALCKVEDIINSHPLAHVAADEILETISPNSFLKPSRAGHEASLSIEIDEVSKSVSELITGYKAKQAIVQHFRSIFYSRHLQFLRE